MTDPHYPVHLMHAETGIAVCGAQPDRKSLIVRWPEVVTCPACRDSSDNNLMGYNS